MPDARRPIEQFTVGDKVRHRFNPDAGVGVVLRMNRREKDSVIVVWEHQHPSIRGGISAWMENLVLAEPAQPPEVDG